MRIEARYSHLNGEEYLLVHRRRLWEEVREVIEGFFEVLREEREAIPEDDVKPVIKGSHTIL